MQVGILAMLGLLLAGAGRMLAAPSAAATPPPTARVPVVDGYFGTRVTDPYRWMEAPGEARFLAWLRAQDEHARATLDRIPGKDALVARVAAHSAGGEAVRSVRLAGGRCFYLKRRPTDEAFRLYVREPKGVERLLVDPTQGDATRAIDYYEPSHDGSLVAYASSSSGSEESVLQVVDVTSGAVGRERIDRTADGSPAWRADGRSFFYNRLARRPAGRPPSETYLNSRVYLHVVGTDTGADRPVLGTGVAGSPPLLPADLPTIRTFPGSRYALAWISHGTDPAATVYVAELQRLDGSGATGLWRRVASASDGVIEAVLHGAELYLLTRKDAPRLQVLATSAAEPDLARAQSIVPPSGRVLRGLAGSSEALYVSELENGVARVRRFDFALRRLADVELPFQGSLRGPTADPAGTAVLAGIQSWVSPEGWYRIDGPRPERTELVEPWTLDSSMFLVEQASVRSWDGTEVPLSIVRRRDVVLDGSHPIWLTAYGAYGIALLPRFLPRLRPLLEDGGIYAVAHVRGGGEQGDPWHREGQLARKPNTYKDLIACAEHLISRGYGSASTLAIEGASGGGIAVGMAMAVRPELFRVVLSQVGDHNPLRLEVGADGPLMAQEFGTTASEAGFRALLAIDSTQAVRPGTAYPAVLVGTAAHDARVPPWQPGKFAAHLQAASVSGRPVLLRVDFEGGHGAASSKSQLDRLVGEQLAFLYWQVGRPGFQPPP